MPNDVDIKGATEPHAIDKESGSLSADGLGQSTLNYRVMTLEQCTTYSEGHPLGWIEKGRTWELLTGGLGYELAINYEGTEEEDSDDYSLDISFAEEPIESHPRWELIKKVYKGRVEDGKVVFTEKLERGGATGLNAGGGGQRKNPLFGVTSYLVLKGVFVHSYTTTQKPHLDSIGTIVKHLPGDFDTPPNHDWLMMPPKMKRAGKNAEGEKVYQVTQEYLMSAIGGWPPEVYGLMEQGGAGGRPDGLSIGSVQGGRL